MKLEGKTAIVTGGSGSIGRASCIEMAKEGAKVVVADLRLEEAHETVQQIEAQGGKAIAVGMDQAKYEDVTKMVETVVEAFGEVNICFANAGIGTFCPFLDITQAGWEKCIDVNLNGTFFVCQAAARQMVKQKKGGKIILASSDAALRPEKQLSDYCVTKAAVSHLVRCMAVELGNYRINVNAILPGVIDTEMVKVMLDRERFRSALRASTPLGRWGKPWEIAKLVVFLASNDADFITGQGFSIDGGWSVNGPPRWFWLDYTETNVVDWESGHKKYPFVRE